MDPFLCLEALDVVKRSREDEWLVGNKKVLKVLLDQDEQYLPSSNYCLSQPHLDSGTRKLVAEWMREVCEEQNCHEDVLVTALNYFDRTLSVAVLKVRRSQLQLLGAVCLFIASKFKDTSPISARSLVIASMESFEIGDLVDFELIVLQSLKWELSCPGPYDFLDQFLFRIRPRLTIDQRITIRRHAATLIVLCVVELQFSIFPPSLVASACLSSAASGLMGNSWCQSIRLQRKLCKLAKTDEGSLQICQEQVDQLLKAITVSSTPTKSSPPAAPTTPTDMREIVLDEG